VVLIFSLSPFLVVGPMIISLITTNQNSNETKNMSSHGSRQQRQQRPLRQAPSPPHHRIVLLFDLDAFYAQTERVRLGLGLDACVALLQ
jgi:hypothetical protein